MPAKPASPSEVPQRMGRSTRREPSLSDTRKYRKFTAQQKTEIVLASLRGPKTMAELGREHDIADSLLRKWREQFLAPGSSVPSRGVLRSPGGGGATGWEADCHCSPRRRQ